MPIFAFANAGVHILGKTSAALAHPIALGVLLGLLLGKPIGITLFARLASVIGLGSRPTAVTWSQIFGASWLCGIGFTMSLFIAGLALGNGDLLDMSKIGTLAASIARRMYRQHLAAQERQNAEYGQGLVEPRD